jgi:hypothetical protein
MWIPDSITGEDQDELDAYIEANSDNPAAWETGQSDGKRNPGSS